MKAVAGTGTGAVQGRAARVARWAGRVLIVPLVLIAWEAGTRAAAQPFFPPPTAVLAHMREQWFSGPPDRFLLTDLALDNFGASLGRLFSAWSIAAVLGVTAGIAIGCLPRLSGYVEPLIHFARAIPPPLLVPVFLTIFKSDTPAQLATIVFGIVWPIVLNSADGARGVDRQHLETARVFGVSAWGRLWRIIMPSASPKIFAGLRLALSLALILMVIAETFAGSDGIGYLLLRAQRGFVFAEVWGCVILLGVLGYLFNTAFLVTERRVLAWHRGARRTI